MGLRIAINALYMIPGKVGGTEIYLRSLLRALAEADRENRYFVFRNRETDADLTPDSIAFVDCPQPVRGENRVARILYEQLRLPRRLAQVHADVVFNAGFTAPLLWGGPQVTVFHDLQYRRHPEYFRWFELPFWQLLLPRAARRSAKIVVLSSAVRGDLIRFYKTEPSKIVVIPHGVDPELEQIRALRANAPPRTKLLLSVSTLHPHKNLDGLLRAFRVFHRRHPEWRLAIVGLKGFEAARIERLRVELGLETVAEITGWIPRDSLYRLFAEAEAFVYPSRFEGFGIPVLEALTAGVPVACSELPSLVEIAGDAARYFDPDREADLVAALEEITGDGLARERRIAAGFERAQRFGGVESARALIQVFQDAASQDAMRSKKSHD